MTDHTREPLKGCQFIINKKQPFVNFINVKHANFTYESLFSSYVLALNELSYKKRAHKMLMKLTPFGSLLGEGG